MCIYTYIYIYTRIQYISDIIYTKRLFELYSDRLPDLVKVTFDSRIRSVDVTGYLKKGKSRIHVCVSIGFPICFNLSFGFQK